MKQLCQERYIALGIHLTKKAASHMVLLESLPSIIKVREDKKKGRKRCDVDNSQSC